MRLCNVNALFLKAFGNHLRPTTRCCAEVHNAFDALEYVESLINLEKLVRAAGSVTFLLGFAVVDVTLVFACFTHLIK